MFRRLLANDTKAVVLQASKFKGLYYIWCDTPKKGDAIVLRIQEITAFELRHWPAKDNPLAFIESLREIGWSTLPREVDRNLEHPV